MKSARVNAKGLTTWMWLSTNGKSKHDLPVNFCDFFWASVLSYMIAIFAWPGHLINLISRDTSKTKAWPWIFHIPVAFTAFAATVGDKKYNFQFSLKEYGLGLLYLTMVCVGLIILIIIIAGIAELVEFIKRQRQKRISRLVKEGKIPADKWGDPISKPLGIVTWWKSFKGKYCPKIEYYNLDSEYRKRDQGFGWNTDTEARHDSNYDDPYYDHHNSEHEI